jgi:hypothetical protein
MATFTFCKPRYVPKLWGYEACICNVLEACCEKGYACKLLNLTPHTDYEFPGVNACSIHYHLKKTETFFVLDGVLFLELFVLRPQKEPVFNPWKLSDFEAPKGFIMYPGTAVTVEAHVAHRFWTQVVTTSIIEASTPDDSQDSYRLCASARGLIMDTSAFVEVRPDGIPIL